MHGSMGESVSEWVRDVCLSHQSDWIYYKQPIKFLVVKVNGMWEDCSPLLITSGKKEEMKEEEKSAGQVKQNRFSIAQGLDSPLASYERHQSWLLKQLMN